MTNQELAARLGIPPEQVTPQGLVEHEFPGVQACMPGNLRSFFVDRVGGSLLRAGLEDTADDAWRYQAALADARGMVQGEEVQAAISHCRSGGAASGAGGAIGNAAASDFRLALVIAGAALAVVAGGAAIWWWRNEEAKRVEAMEKGAGQGPSAASRRRTA